MQILIYSGDTFEIKRTWVPPDNSGLNAEAFTPYLRIGVGDDKLEQQGTYADKQFKIEGNTQFSNAIKVGTHDYQIYVTDANNAHRFTIASGQLISYGVKTDDDIPEERYLLTLRQHFEDRIKNDPSIINYSTNHINSGGLSISKTSTTALYDLISKLENKAYWKRQGNWSKRL